MSKTALVTGGSHNIGQGIAIVLAEHGWDVAITYRNRWMVDKSDYVITCVNRNFGGAAKAKEYAEKHRKNIVEI